MDMTRSAMHYSSRIHHLSAGPRTTLVDAHQARLSWLLTLMLVFWGHERLLCRVQALPFVDIKSTMMSSLLESIKCNRVAAHATKNEFYGSRQQRGFCPSDMPRFELLHEHAISICCRNDDAIA